MPSLLNRDTTTRASVDELAEEVRHLRLTMFAGAGISRDAGLPLVTELTSYILHRLRMPEDSQRALHAARIPFELFIETLAELSDASALFDIYCAGKPCDFHRLCAELAKSGQLNSIVTTNFDLLFEMAFADARVPLISLWKEEDLQAWRPCETPVTVLKLHGSAHDTARLGITIRRVASRQGVESRGAALRSAMTQPDTDLVVIAGYSGSDRFDINPALERLAGSERPLLLIDHSPGAGSLAKVGPLKDYPRAGPFANLRGVAAECDTLQFTRGFHLDARVPASPPGLPTWQSQVDRWLGFARLTQGRGFETMAKGALLRSAALPKRAARHFVRAVASASTPTLRLNAQIQLAKCQSDLGRYREADRNSRSVLQGARGTGANELAVGALLELGIVAAARKDYDQALRYYRKAEMKAKMHGLDQFAAICLGNAAIVRKNLGGMRRWRRALADYGQALTIARQLGDKRSEGRTIGNIGVLQARMGDAPAAISSFREARKIAASLGDRYHEAIWLANEGDQLWTSDPVSGRTRIEDARRMFDALGSPARVRDCDEMLDRLSAGAVSTL